MAISAVSASRISPIIITSGSWRRIDRSPAEQQVRELGLTLEIVGDRPFYRPGPGCETCQGKGYRGRSGVHELLLLNDELRALIMQRVDAAAIRRAAVELGMPILRDDGAQKVLAGLTTAEEIVRVTQAEML